MAKNFQDYFVNVITQQVGARIYADGVRHSLELPYTLFEDQRSGETLGKLQKVRTDVERFISLAVNMVFTTLIGLVFVMIYASCVHWSVAPAYLLTVPLLGGLSSLLSRKIKEVQKHIVRETTALAGATTESLRNIELVKSLGLAQLITGRNGDFCLWREFDLPPHTSGLRRAAVKILQAARKRASQTVICLRVPYQALP